MHVRLRLAALCLPLAPALWTVPMSGQTSTQQAAVYATADLALFTPVDNGHLRYTTDKFGFVAGGFYNFAIDSRFKPGIDLRVVESPNGAGGTALLVAVRGSFVPNHNPLRPYLQIGGGVISASNQFSGQNSGARVTGGGVELDFGLDIRLTPRLDLRLPDYGAAAGGKVGTAFLGGGLVYHLN